MVLAAAAEVAPVPPLAMATVPVTFPAVVAVVAVVAFPLSAAVIVPALKLPEASRATSVLPVFAFVALEVTVNVEVPD